MTAETLGKQLAHARTLKGLTLEDAAHVTKIRPDKLAALEHDDLSAFPNNTYARGFLQIYGRFLGVDVSDLASQLDSGNPISVQDYQYLNVELDAEPEQHLRMRPRESQSRRPSVVPLIVFVALLAVVVFVVNFVIKAQQLVAPDPARRAPVEAGVEKPAAQPGAPAAVAAPRATPVPELSDRDFIANAAPQPQPAAPAPATPAPVQLPAPTPRIAQLTVAQLPALNELSIEPVKKSRVRIRRNDFAAAPVFEDFLYPDVGPLKIKGSKFYVEVLGDGAVNIRKNGQPFAYQAPGVVIQ